MCVVGSLAATLSRLCLATQDVLLARGAVSTAANGGVAISFAIVAIVAVSIAVVAIGYSVIYQGAILILTKLADQLGFQS